MHPVDFIREQAGVKGAAIDECQLAPELFPALKEWVRTHPRPGQFFMSGSVRFTSRAAIRESLTGRISNLEVYPFGVAELAGLPLPTLVRDLAGPGGLKSVESLALGASLHRQRSKVTDLYLEAGGLPGICFVRDSKSRTARIEEQLSTILDRDLRTVQPIRLPYRQILDFLMELAKSEGSPINHVRLRTKTGISSITQKKLLYALEAVFIVRAHPIRGESLKWTYLFEDQAEWRWLAGISAAGSSESEAQAWNGAVYRNLRLQFAYRLGEQVSFSSFSTRSGVHIPLVLETPQGLLGVIPILEDQVPYKQLMGAHSFLRHSAKSSVIFVSRAASRTKVMGDRTALIPASLALFE